MILTDTSSKPVFCFLIWHIFIVLKQINTKTRSIIDKFHFNFKTLGSCTRFTQNIKIRDVIFICLRYKDMCFFLFILNNTLKKLSSGKKISCKIQKGRFFSRAILILMILKLFPLANIYV